MNAKKNQNKLSIPLKAPMVLMPFQREAETRAVARLKNNRAVYLALDPGLGKTILACKLREQFDGAAVYVCPAGLSANVHAEFEKWGRGRAIDVVTDTMLSRYSGPATIGVLFVDEAHRFSNPKSQRSKALFELGKRAKKVVLLSGSPSPNTRPAELWPILLNFAPKIFGTEFFPFARKYCGAKKGPFGWKFDGFTNRQEFKAKLYKSFMIRMKKDVLDLPEKREGLLYVGEGIPPIVSKLEQKIVTKYTTEDTIEKQLAELEGVPALHLSNYLKLLGVHKLKYVLPVIDRMLLETNEKLLIFAMHTEVIDALKKHYRQFKPIVITGKTPVKKRKGRVDKFQNNPKRRVAILNIIAGGIGWTLTAADRVLFVEFSWRDGDNSQAGDRAHRIGRDRPVLIQYVVLKDSIDAKRMSVVLNKRRHAV